MKVLMKSIFPEGINANIDLPTGKKVECCIDNTIPQNLTPVPSDTIRFFVTTQPEGDYNKIILNNPQSFTYVLTQFPDLLQLPNAGKLVGCGSFVDPDSNIKKKFGVSIVMTNRNCLPGHPIRHEIYARRKEIRIPFDIYASTWNQFTGTTDTIPMPPWPDRKGKIIVFDCMFHICIEGHKKRDQYSEKLVDALITKTIPIYYGCINVDEYFNPKGIIQVNSASDIINVCNQLTAMVYERMLPCVEDNYENGLKVYKYEDILRDAMLRIINK